MTHQLYMVMGLFLCLGGVCHAQSPMLDLEQLDVRDGVRVSTEVRAIYQKGVDYIASKQRDDGSFSGSQRGESSAVCALATMTFLSTGEDPNFGKYAGNIRSALRHIIRRQDPKSGYIPGSMYVHGFSMLALAEAYGAVDEEILWDEDDGGDKNSQRSIGEALDLAVRLAVTSQKKNPSKGWRYSPNQTTADTSIVGAVLMGLLAARNAGIDVPDESIDGALEYVKSMTSVDSGYVDYVKNGGGIAKSVARSSISCLVFSLGKRDSWPELAAAKKFINSQPETGSHDMALYERYYKAQALFQSDYESWERWNRDAITEFRAMQTEEGQIGKSDHGEVYATSMSLLAIALNFRLLPIYER